MMGWPVEMKRRQEVAEKLACTVYIWICYQIDLVALYIGGQVYFTHLFSFIMWQLSENKRSHEIGIL